MINVNGDANRFQVWISNIWKIILKLKLLRFFTVHHSNVKFDLHTRSQGEGINNVVKLKLNPISVYKV